MGFSSARFELGREPRKLAGPAFALVRAGTAVVHDDSGRRLLRIETGDLLTVTVGEGCALVGAQACTRLVALEIDPLFASQAASLADCSLALGAEPLLVDRRGSDVARRANRLLRELESPSGRSARARFEAAARLLELLALAFEPRATDALRRPARSLHGDVEELLAKRLESVSIAALAQRLGLSTRQVSRLVRLEYGRTFQELVCERRLERAKLLLATTGKSVIEIAGEVGFGSLAHFNAVFRVRVGQTPSRYRRWRESE